CDASPLRSRGRPLRSLRRSTLWNRDLNLRAREGRQVLGQWHVIVPVGHDCDPRRAAPNRELTIPPAEIASHAGEPLSATRITKAAHAANHRILECRGVVPSVAALLARRALERLARSEEHTSELQSQS